MKFFKFLSPVSGYVNDYVIAQNEEEAIKKYENDEIYCHCKPNIEEIGDWINCYEVEKVENCIKQNMGQWINCNENLPEKGKVVLVVRQIYGLKEMYAAYLDDEGWCDNCAGEKIVDVCTYPITHWTNLPKPPIS